MEYVFNWLVLILSLGAIVVVALVCCADLKKGGARNVETSAPVVEAQVAMPQAELQAVSGPYVELVYRRGDTVEYTQKVSDGQKGYIGTESYPNLGAGMPVRYLEIVGRGGEFYVSNLDWQMPVRVVDETGDTELEMGQAVPVLDGTEFALPGGWTVECRISEVPQV